MIKRGGNIPKRYIRHQGKAIIGIDEFNNGHHIESIPLIVAAYYVDNYDSGLLNINFGKKGGFSAKTSLQEKFPDRAKAFLLHYPDFRYATISRESNPIILLHLRAIAMSYLIINIIETYKPDNDNVYVLFDAVNNKKTSELVGSWIDGILEDELGRSLPFYFRKNGENNPVVRAADLVAYSLAGLKARNPDGKWPCRERRIKLEGLVKRHVG